MHPVVRRSVPRRHAVWRSGLSHSDETSLAYQTAQDERSTLRDISQSSKSPNSTDIKSGYARLTLCGVTAPTTNARATPHCPAASGRVVERDRWFRRQRSDIHGLLLRIRPHRGSAGSTAQAWSTSGPGVARSYQTIVTMAVVLIGHR